jgi:hypothetical protein
VERHAPPRDEMNSEGRFLLGRRAPPARPGGGNLGDQ